ncbi:MAG: hypothetical protein OD811_04580 [Alphaproteobacteria bacterium]
MFDLLVFNLSPQTTGGLNNFAELNAINHRLRPGRFAVFYWPLAQEWRSTHPLESELVQALCGDTNQRKQEEIKFFVNMGVRVFSRQQLLPIEELFVMVFRKSGPPLRERKTEDSSLINKNKLNTHDFAFTRDLVNNVWHVYKKDGIQKQLVTRFARLLTWNDEKIGIWNGSHWRSENSENLPLNLNLVPVAAGCPRGL